ncbi:molybdopterin-dependent oxidoreductase [Wukongibacter baidiensis]|uniref:molybdopterin-containing oxidoreductase family protein n=1 Tax=Wukongibacter baidiensis TaxID=1723361 RepID=UPI003D7F68EC
MSDKKVVQSLCRMCDDHCGINVYIENEKVVDIDGYKPHYWNKGRICVKGRAGVDMIYAEDRILKPLKRTETGWEEIELEQALDEIAEKMKELKENYGARSMSIWKGEAIGFAQQEEMARRFIHAFGSPNYFSNDSECFVGRWIGYSLVAGTWPAQPDFENSNCIVIWGANPPMAHPNMTQSIMKAKENGAKIIVIDTRLSAIARQADVFAQIRPGTDGALAHGIMRYLINNNEIDNEFVKDYTLGFEKLKDYVQKFTPEYVEEQTEVPKETLLEIAKLISRRKPNVVNYVGNGLEHHQNGINNIRAVGCIDGLIGAFDVKGGNFMPEGFGLRELTLYEEIPLRHLDPIGADKFPVLYDFRQECHTMTAMNTILTEDPYPLKGMIIAGANPVLTNPNSEKVIKALESLELLVVRDLFMSESAQLAHYVLPAASYLERSELHCHGGYQIVGLTERVFTIPQVQDEYQFLHDLAHRLEIGDYFPWKNEDELNEWLVEPTGVSLEEIKACPQGYRYKPIRYKKYKEKPFKTPSGKVEFASKYLKDYGYEELPEYIPPAYKTNPKKEYPFTLITGARKLVYYHGRNRNFKRFRTAIPSPEIELHPQDAEKLGVTDKDIVKVTSTIGSIEIPVNVVSETEILPGVTQITHGWKEANVNLITHDDKFDPIDGFPLMKSVQVKIEKK